MAIAKITTWINDPARDYHLGVLLYDQYGDNQLLKVLLKNGQSTYHQDRLLTALEDLNPTLEESTNKTSFKLPSVEEIAVPVKRYGINDDQWNNLPEAIRDLYVKNSKLHRHSQMVFDQLRIAQTDQERLDFGLQILAERKELNNSWKTIKDYHEKGKLQEQIQQEQQKASEQLTISELIKESKNIPTYISKAKKNLIDLKPGLKMNKALLRLQQLEIRLESVKKQLEGVQ